MGALPKRRHSRRRQGQRRQSLRITLINLITCPHCGAKKKPHRRCEACGKP